MLKYPPRPSASILLVVFWLERPDLVSERGIFGSTLINGANLTRGKGVVEYTPKITSANQHHFAGSFRKISIIQSHSTLQSIHTWMYGLHPNRFSKSIHSVGSIFKIRSFTVWTCMVYSMLSFIVLNSVHICSKWVLYVMLPAYLGVCVCSHIKCDVIFGLSCSANIAIAYTFI